MLRILTQRRCQTKVKHTAEVEHSYLKSPSIISLNYILIFKGRVSRLRTNVTKIENFLGWLAP